jgi:hypothetical protein
MRTRARFTRLDVTLLLVAASAPALVDCSRVSTPEPAAVSDAAPAPPASEAASVPSAPETTPPPPASDAASAAPPSDPPTAKPSSAPTASATPPSSGTKPSDCARRDDTPGLSDEDRARSRATCEAKEEMRAFVAARQSCASASECTNLGGSCPFGCFLPVSKRAAPEVSAKLEELGARLDKAGHRCVYRCMGAPAPACVAGRCTTGAP